MFVCCQAAWRQPLSSTDKKINFHHSSQCCGRRSKRVPPKRKSETLLFKPTWIDWTLHYICYASAGVHQTREGPQSGHVIHLAPGILKWTLDLWKSFVPLCCEQVHICTRPGERPKGWIVKNSEVIKTIMCVRVHTRNAQRNLLRKMTWKMIISKKYKYVRIKQE
jgi:hypothetical protein